MQAYNLHACTHTGVIIPDSSPMYSFLTSNFHGLNVAIVFTIMEEKTGISVTALDKPVGMLQGEKTS